jgi:nucleotide-binding universal stress UspA family protein
VIFKSILAPVDGSAPSNAAAALAVRLAKEGGASLAFCHAERVPRPAHDAGGFAREQMMEEQNRTAHEVLDAATKLAADAGVEAKTALIGEPIADAIVQAAKDSGADLIVMGTHGRSGIVRAVLGSVTADVIGRTDLPVMVAPHVPR